MAVAVAVAMALVAGCSGSEATGSGTTTTTAADPTTELVDAARRYNQALVAPTASSEDAADIHALLTPECADGYTVDEVQALLIDGIEGRRISMGGAAEELRLGQLTPVDVLRSTADVLVTYVTPTDDDPLGWGAPYRQSWVLVDGAWRTGNLCAPTSGIDGRSDVFTPLRVEAEGLHRIATDDDDRFATSWAVVVNNLDEVGVAFDVIVAVRFYDADDEEVGAEEVTILSIEPLATAAAGGMADAPGAVRMESTVRATTWDESEPGWAEMSGVVEERTPAEGFQEESTSVSGTVTNLSSQDLSAVPVLVLRDAEGQVVGGMGDVLAFGYAPPGGTIPFSTIYPGVLPEAWTVDVYVTPAAPVEDPLLDLPPE